MFDAVLPGPALCSLLLLGHLQHRDAGVCAVGAQGGLRYVGLAVAPWGAHGSPGEADVALSLPTNLVAEVWAAEKKVIAIVVPQVLLQVLFAVQILRAGEGWVQSPQAVGPGCWEAHHGRGG